MRTSLSLSAVALLFVGCADNPVTARDAASDVLADVSEATDGAACTSAVRVEGGTPSFFWVGQATEAATSALVWEGAACGDLAVDADVPWLRGSLASTSQIRVELIGAMAPGGVHRGRVRLRDATGRVLTFVDVDLRALGSSRPDAAPKVLIIGIDGVRGDAMEGATLPNLRSLLPHAAASFHVSTQLTGPTTSGPGWTSILTGVGPDRHRVVANGEYSNRDLAWPTFLARAHDDLHLRVAVAAQWPDIVGGIIEARAMDVRTWGLGPTVSSTMVRWLASSNYDVHFTHFDDVDHAGHSTGFGLSNPDYRAALEGVDGLVRPLFDAIVARPGIADERWLVVVCTDHGGAGTSHGALDHDNRDVPLFVAGPTVVPRMPEGFVSHMDVHPTVMRFLGVVPSASWRLDSRPLGVAYETACGDSADDDGDGLVDCADADCASDPRCAAVRR